MLPFTLADVIIGFIVTWVLGLTPAIIARRKNKGPLNRRDANLIAAGSCVFFAVIFFAIKLAVHTPHPRFSAAWIIVFFVSRWIMVRPVTDQGNVGAEANSKNAGPSEFGQRLTRDQITQKLEEMVANPLTSDDHRFWAKGKLEAFNRRKSNQSSARAVRTAPQRFSMPRLRKDYLRRGLYVLCLVVAADVVVIASGYRVLVWQRIVRSGETYQAGDWGDLGSYGRPVMGCWYWSGRTMLFEAFWYGHGKSEHDECEALHRHKSGER